MLMFVHVCVCVCYSYFRFACVSVLMYVCVYVCVYVCEHHHPPHIPPWVNRDGKKPMARERGAEKKLRLSDLTGGKRR